MKKYNFIVFFLFITLNLVSQTIKGSVNDSLGQPVFANILIKKNKTTKNVIQYTVTDDMGKFNMSLNQPLDSLTIEVSSYGYKSQKHSIILSNSNKQKYSFAFVLKDELNKLNEVVLKTNKRIQIKNDTTIYNPNAFKDGTERTVEDLLKKLPGIEVKTNGEIKFKGKSIKKLMLDGDDLFGSNYTIGSRNINVDLIDNIQGLDNYEDNPLLKGLQDTDDVALNIVLKKGKTDFSGNSDLHYGIENRWKLYTSGLLVNKKVKAFSLISYNNIGDNNSKYDLNSELLIQNIDRKRLNAKSLLTEGYFGSILDDSFHSMNSSFFNSNNAIFKLFKKSSLKVNFGIYANELNRINESFTEINDGTSQIDFFNIERLTKSPKIFSSQVLFSNKEKDSLHWEYSGVLTNENTTFKNKSNNNSTQQLGRLQSEVLNTFHNFNIVSRTNRNTAIEGIILYNYSQAPQSLIITPGTIFDSSSNIELESQDSEFQKHSLQSKIGVIGSKGFLKYNISSGYNYFYSKLNTALSSTQNESNSSLNNDMSYAVNSLYFFPKSSFRFNKGLLKLGINVQHNTLTYHDKINDLEIDKTDIILSPNLSFNYEFSKKVSANAIYSYNELLPEEDKLYSNIIQTNFRSFSSNTVDLRYIKTNQLSTKFKYYDFFKRTTILLEGNYLFNKGNYFNQSIINEDITVNSNFYNPAINRSYNVLLSYESYFHFLRSTLKLDTSYTIALDKNVINNSELREVESKNLQFSFMIRSGFKSNFNVENISNFERNTFEAINQTNQILSFRNQFKTIYKLSKRFYSTTILSYISPDLTKSTNYTFLDTKLVFNTLEQRIQIALVGKNLTNNKKFETVSVNDYSRSRLSYNLIERYVLLNLSFSF
ncbi:carboxypeptidase-like regulatory domain-containing protein [Psychroserpens mesophilus]|uniref:carboxypeptidase-like regulatory domain-containing protein n=1 Tax=Psychroserpens mesophilus TaxID=325473 RepID=UPI003D647F05